VGGLAAISCLLLHPSASSASADGCGTTSSASDYNGDGFDDAAVGDPYATVAGVAEAGAVTVLLGEADGRVGEGGREVLTRASLGETPRAGDHFGFDVALAPGGHHHRCADLLVGAPGVDEPGAVDAGMAYAISDLPDAEGTPQLEAFVLTQADAGGVAEAGDQLGYAVAITGLDQEGRRRLVVSAPGETIGGAAGAGSVTVWETDGEPQGLAELRQGRRGPLGAVRLPGAPQAGDRFGTSVASGLVDLPEVSGQEVAQGLLIGAPGDTVSGRDGAGSVTVLSEKFESAALLSQDVAGVPGAAEAGDQFGYSLALSPPVGSAARTLAVGAPGEDTGVKADTGSVTLFDNAGERFVARTAFSQGTPGVPGANEPGDRFGFALAFGHRTPTLLVGIPTEDIGGVVDAGAVQPVVVPATPRPLRFLAAVDEDTPGTPATVGTGHRFGRSLGALSGQSENLLTISSVYAGQGSVYVLTDRAGLPPRSWLPTSASGRFGWSVSN
jgi:hypothetical protein